MSQKSKSEDTENVLDGLESNECSKNPQSDATLYLNSMLEKMVVLKRNFMLNGYKTNAQPSNNNSILSKSEIGENIAVQVDENQDRSVSTEVSVCQVIGNISEEKQENLDNSTYINLGNPDANRDYLSKVQKYFKTLEKYVHDFKVKVGLRFIDYFINVFITNHIFKEEIDIVFQFFHNLIDHKKKISHLTDEAFSKLFYDFILILNVDHITETIYDTIENYLLYTNRFLKVIKFESNKLVLNEKSIFGFKTIFSIFCNTQKSRVQKKCEMFINTVVKAQMTLNPQSIATLANYYYSLVYDNLNQSYMEIGDSYQERRIERILQFCLNLFKEISFSKVDFNEKSNQGEMFEVFVCDARYNNAKEKFKILTGKNQKLKDLKITIARELWARPENICLLTKGMFLKFEERTISSLKIEPFQTIMVVEKNVQDHQLSFEAKQNIKEKVDLLKSIFQNIDFNFLSKVLESSNYDVQEAILVLSDQEKYEDLQVDYKNSQIPEKSPKFENKLKFQLRSKFSSSIDIYVLLLKISLMKNAVIRSLVWTLFRTLPPCQILTDNIEKFIENCGQGKIVDFEDIMNNGRIILSDFLVEHEALPNILFAFNLRNAIISSDEFEEYKMEIFKKMITIFIDSDDEIDENEKFKAKKSFVENGGLSFFINLYKNLVFQLEESKKELIIGKLILQVMSFLKDYFYASLLLSFPDPYKKSKQVFGRKVAQEQNLQKFQEMEGVIRRTNSTDNIFAQNLNTSKRNKSQRSTMTPNFQSPSILIRPFTFSVVKIKHSKSFRNRQRRPFIFRNDL